MANNHMKLFLHLYNHCSLKFLTHKYSILKSKVFKPLNTYQSYNFAQRLLSARTNNLALYDRNSQYRTIDNNENSLFYQLLKDSDMYICAEQMFFDYKKPENSQNRNSNCLDRIAATFQQKLGQNHENLAPLIVQSMKLIACSSSNLINETILFLMYCLVQTSRQTQYFTHSHHILSFVERECLRRLPHLSMRQKLLAADILIQNSPKPSLQYLECMVKSVLEDKTPTPGSIKGHKFAQIMYYFNVVRYMDPHLATNLISVFKELLPTLTPHQLALACAGFFKTNNLIRDQALLIEILDRTNETLPVLLQGPNLPYLNMLLKTVRSGLTLRDSSRLACQTFLESLTSLCYNPSQSLQLPLNILAQASWLATNLLLVNHKFIELILARLQTRTLTSARFKDITKLVWCLASLNPNCHVNSVLRGELGESITKELCVSHRTTELDRYIDQLCVLLYSFSLCGYYPEPLIHRFHQSLLEASLKPSLNPDNSITTPFVTASRSKVVFDLDDICLALYASLQIERPSVYSNVKHPLYCDRLSGHLESLVSSYLSQAACDKPLSSPAPNFYDSAADRMQSSKTLYDELFHHLTTLQLAPDCEIKCYKLGILPHSPTHDLYVTSGNASTSLPPNARTIHAHLTGQPHVLLLPAPYQAFNSVEGLTGKYNAKMRQLKQLGYHVRLIPWYEWHKAVSQGNTTPYLSLIIRDIFAI